MPARKLDEKEVQAFVRERTVGTTPTWAFESEALVRSYRFGAYRDGVAFAVAVALLAERRDHHPDIEIRYGSVRVLFTTHDAGGVTELDRDLALACDELAARHGEVSPT